MTGDKNHLKTQREQTIHYVHMCIFWRPHCPSKQYVEQQYLTVLVLYSFPSVLENVLGITAYALKLYESNVAQYKGGRRFLKQTHAVMTCSRACMVSSCRPMIEPWALILKNSETVSLSLCVQAHVLCIGCREILCHAPFHFLVPSCSLWARVGPSIRDRLHFDHTSKKLGARVGGRVESKVQHSRVEGFLQPLD